MSLVFEQRASDSPYIETVTQGRTVGTSTVIRPAEIHWHLVFVRHQGQVSPLFVGPLTASGQVSFVEGVELLWVKFRVGTFMPHLEMKQFVDAETAMPDASGQSFWLNGATWQFPSYDNAETFASRLVREGIVAYDNTVTAALQTSLRLRAWPSVPCAIAFYVLRVLRKAIFARLNAPNAQPLLRQGYSILDTVYEAGYFDQPHLTRSLRQWVGYTPAQIVRMSRPCQPINHTGGRDIDAVDINIIDEADREPALR